MLALGREKRFRNWPCPQGAQSGWRAGGGSTQVDRSVSGSGGPGKSRGDFWGGMGSPEQVLKDKVRVSQVKKKKESAFQAGEHMSKGTEMRKSVVLQLGIAGASTGKEEAKEMGQIQLMQSPGGYPGKSGDHMQY